MYGLESGNGHGRFAIELRLRFLLLYLSWFLDAQNHGPIMFSYRALPCLSGLIIRTVDCVREEHRRS